MKTAKFLVLILIQILTVNLSGQVSWQDSMDLYTNSMLVKAFYDNDKSYRKVNNREMPNNPHAANRTAIRKFTGENLEVYYKRIDKIWYYQRETDNLILNLDAPPQLFNDNIKPTKMVKYDNDDTKSIHHGDIVCLYIYDERIKPKERVKRVSEKSIPIATVKHPAPIVLRRDGELIQNFSGVPNLKIVSDRSTGSLRPFAIENQRGDRIDFKAYINNTIPLSFQYPNS